MAKLALRHQVVILIVSSFVTMIGFVTPFLPKLIIDQGVPKKDMGIVVSAILLGLIIQMITMFSSWFTALYRNQIYSFIRYISTSDMLNKLANISPKYTSSMRTGDIVGRLNGLESGVNFIYSSVETILRSILQLITLPALLLAMDYRILLFGLPSVAVTIIVWFFAQKIIKVLQTKSIESSATTASSLYDVVSALPELQISNLCKRAINQYKKDYVKSWNINIYNDSFSSFISSLQSQIASITLIALQIYGWNLVIKAEWTIGMMSTIVFTLNMIRQPIMEFLNLRQSIMINAIQVKRYFEFFDIQNMNAQGEVVLPVVSHTIAVKSISFSYDDSSDVIYGLSAGFKPNCISVITGNSGSGKTTLIKILSGLLPIKSGNIQIDGKDLCDLNLERWRSQISSIPQNPYFIQGSVRDNLKFGFSPDAQYFEKVVDMCYIRDVDRRFYAKNVGESGKALSSGEKQRISFARAMLQNRPVFILDEPLSQVDIPTANKILENVLPILQTRTCILVTHNPLWMDVATNIYTMFDGKLFEGRHWQ